jgi:hypothetical protein
VCEENPEGGEEEPPFSVRFSHSLAHTFAFPFVPQVGPMERAVLESIPKFHDLVEALTKAGVADLVWGVVGGNPASYDLLNTKWIKAGREDIVAVAEAFVWAMLKEATKIFNETKASNRRLVGPVYDQFKSLDKLPASIRELHVLPTPDKVLRLLVTEGRGEEDVLVPSSPAMALVLRYSVKGEPPALEVVREAVGEKKKKKKKEEGSVPAQEVVLEAAGNDEKTTP